MSTIDFALKPYPGLSYPADVQVSGTARREGSLLHLKWRLEGPAGSLAIAQVAPQPERRRELWEATCFEFFLKSPEKPGYWEFNLAPSGHWNAFRFDSYRAGMTDEETFHSLPFAVSTRPGVCEATVSIDMTELGLEDAPWHLAIAMVVAEATGRVTYRALSHPGTQPDFHHPDAFVVRL